MDVVSRTPQINFCWDKVSKHISSSIIWTHTGSQNTQGHSPFICPAVRVFAADMKTTMRNVAFLYSPRWDARRSYQLLPQDAVIFQSPERRAQLWAADSPPCGQSWSYIQPQVHFWAPVGDFTNSPFFPWISLTSPSHIKLYMVFNNIAWWKLHWLFAVLRLVS